MKNENRNKFNREHEEDADLNVKTVYGAACPRCHDFVKGATTVILCSKCGYYDPTQYVFVNGAIRSRAKMLKKVQQITKKQETK